jgi:hypothetical protein
MTDFQMLSQFLYGSKAIVFYVGFDILSGAASKEVVMIDGKDVIAFGVEMDEFYLEDDMVA